VYYYFWVKAGRKGDTGFIDLLPKASQLRELDVLIKHTAALLSVCEKRPGSISSLVKGYDDRDGLEASWDFTQNLAGVLKCFKKGSVGNRVGNRFLGKEKGA
jgi:hypothetical protein